MLQYYVRVFRIVVDMKIVIVCIKLSELAIYTAS